MGPGEGQDEARGRHEDPQGHAAGYFTYFNGGAHEHGPAGDPALGYYDYLVGDNWHVVVLNSNCSERDFDPLRKGCAADSAQARWLKDVLTDPTKRRACTLAYAHHPPFGSGEHGGTDDLRPLWTILADNNVDLYLAGHNHGYERFAPLNKDGQLDRATGVRSFVVGTGGRSWRSFDTVAANSEHQGAYEVFGVLDLALKPGGYSWAFIPDANPGGPPLDNGADRCH